MNNGCSIVILSNIFVLLGKSASEATAYGCAAMTKRVGNTAGAITVSNKGEVGISFTSERMSWAYQRRGKLYSGIEKEDQFCEDA
jgi:beta-aspartyl-peptidase (threonine type)